MRAIVLEEHGGPEVLTMREVPDPVPGPGEVLVEVSATAVNRADLLQRMGLYPGPPMEHEIPGLEFAGTVVSLGPGFPGPGHAWPGACGPGGPLPGVGDASLPPMTPQGSDPP